jgi:hypothetical protein
VTAVHAHRFDVGAERFTDSKAVEGKERDQRVVPGGAQSGLYEEAAELVTVRAEGA